MIALAATMKLNDFTGVKEKVNKMIEDLQKEKGEEEKFMAECEKNLKENDDAANAKNEERAALETNIDSLTMSTEKLTEEIATLKSEIAQTLMEMKRASEDREKENKVFQAEVADQRATQ